MISLSNYSLSSYDLGGYDMSGILFGVPRKNNKSPVPGLKGLQGLYMGKGLTNEMMSRDPVWRDKSGKGNHIQLKNFGWKLQSGVGMYAHDFSSKWGLFHSSNSLLQSTSIVLKSGTGNWGVKIDKGAGNSVNFKAKLIVEGLDKLDDIKLYFGKFDLSPGSTAMEELHEGLNAIDVDIPSSYCWYGFGFKQTIENANVKITLLPYAYDGALCFDGVDDYGICETFPIFTKEKGYTVMALRKWISREPDFVNLVTNTASWGVDGAFSLEYKNGQTGLLNSAVNFGSANGVDLPYGVLTYQTSESYNGVTLKKGERIGTNTVLLSRSALNGLQFYSSFALYALAIIDHDTTAEERQLVIDYWKKEYPELFPDQAWTVTGKTNSDADRATIKNITGNGNDLVLTNFAFAENSGYGLYHQNFNLIYINNATHGTISNKNYKSFTWTALINYPVNNAPTYWGSGRYVNKRFGIILSSNLPDFKINLRWVNKEDVVVRVQELHLGYNLIDAFTDEDFDSLSALAPGTRIVTPMSPGDWFTLEQVPDYEGYLLTDGVDDRIVSSQNIPLSKDYTIVGDWKLLANENKSCGVVRVNLLYIYNHTSGIQLYVNTTSKGVVLKNIKSLKAVCSNGKVYDEDWNEIIIETGDLITDPNKLYLGYLSSNYTQLAFKNLAIYNDTILTKDQCIRAYNYLQTIKNN